MVHRKLAPAISNGLPGHTNANRLGFRAGKRWGPRWRNRNKLVCPYLQCYYGLWYLYVCITLYNSTLLGFITGHDEKGPMKIRGTYTIYKAYCSGHFFQEISQILCPKYGTIVPSHFRIQVRSPMISSSLGGDLSPLISAFHSAFFMGKSTISCRLGHGLIRSRTVNVRDPEGSWSAAP